MPVPKTYYKRSMRDFLRRLLERNYAQRIGGFGLYALMSRWMKTLDYRVAYYDPSCDVGRIEYTTPVIYLIWHEYMTLPFFVRRRTGLALLTSRHRDASLLVEISHLSGFQIYRGSSGRGGVQVIREILADANMNGMVITPDGPRGPRREVAAGAIYLASRLGFPIVLVGGGLDRPMRNRYSWDKFAIPRWHSRARMIFSPKITLPPKLKREELEAVRLSMQQSLHNLTDAAEAWAASNRPCENSTFFYPGPFSCDSPIRHQNGKTDVGL